MASQLQFSEGNRKLAELMFGIKLNVSTTAISENEFTDIYRSLRKRYPEYFGKTKTIYDDLIHRCLIVDPKDNRKVIISAENITYQESDKFYKDTFNNICQSLYEFYIETKKVQLEDIKIIGKVYTYTYELESSVIELLKNKTNLYLDEEMSRFEIRATFIKDDKNTHLWLTAIDDKDLADEINPNTLSVKVDVNNQNQINGVDPNTLNNIIKFVDEFAKEELNNILNSYLG